MQIQADASQLEWRTILQLSQDQVGIAEIDNGEDTHSLNQVAFELPSRLIAKIYLFRTIFRGSGWSFANDVNFQHVSSDPKYWDSINEKFFNKYKGIAAQHERWKDLVVAGDPIVGPFGRSWSINMVRDNWGNMKIPWTTLSNYPVQGTGADVMMIARISFWNRLRKLNLTDVKLVATVHDSIVVDYKDKGLTDTLALLFYEVFDDLPKNINRLFNCNWNVRLDCECKVGNNLRDMVKYPRPVLTK